MDDVLVSVIVPAYNTEQYIDEMIRCLLAQTYRNLQIIVVDDGSTDRTAEIIKSYADRDKRIEFYSQKNSGVSAARNKGLDYAKGKWVFFFDSDDTFKNNLISDCVRIAESKGVETVLYGYTSNIDGKIGHDYKSILKGDYVGSEIVDHVIPQFLGHSYNDINAWIAENKGLREGKEHTALWRCMLSLDVINQNNIRFDKRLSLGEDTKFINTYLLKTRSINIYPETLYFLRHRSGSANITSNQDPILMTRNKIKLIEARKQIDQEARAGGGETYSFWNGTMVLSTIQLALRLSHNEKADKTSNYSVYKEYIENPDVKKANKEFIPCFGVKSIPFRIVKIDGGKLLYKLCQMIPTKFIGNYGE